MPEAELYDQSMFKPSLSVFKHLTKRKIVCEFLGTLAFVFFANWSYISFRLNNQSASSYGLSVGLLHMSLIYLGKDISGAIYNPAMILALIMHKTLKMHIAGTYVMTQILATTVATFLIRLTMPSTIMAI